jgi:hypothetical protein
MGPAVVLFGILGAIGTISVCTFISIAVWTGTRVQEREAYYKSEVLKRIAEAQGTGAEAALEAMREEERAIARRAAQSLRQGTMLGGLVLMASGVSLIVFLCALIPRSPVFLCGLIPLLIGLALSGYSHYLAPKE